MKTLGRAMGKFYVLVSEGKIELENELILIPPVKKFNELWFS